MRTVRMNGTWLTTVRPSTLSIFIFVGLFHFLWPETTFSQGETTSAIVGHRMTSGWEPSRLSLTLPCRNTLWSRINGNRDFSHVRKRTF
jgi:hypothetical protein